MPAVHLPRVARQLAAIIAVGAISVPSALTSAHAASPAGHGTGPAAERLADRKPMSARDAARISAAGRKFVASSIDGAAGLWLAVWDPELGYFEQAFGNADAGRRAKVSDPTYIGSITKTALATAVLAQVSQGRMRLSDTVADIDPALARRFPAIGQINVRDLLGMTSGIPDYADAAVPAMLKDPQRHFSRDDLIALGLASGARQPVGTAAYSTTNYLILGELLQKVTRRTPEQLVNAVFAQAGMTHSRLPVPGRARPAGLVHGYLGRLLPSQLPAGSQVPPADTDVTGWAFDWGREGGGAYATIGDLAQWGSTCLGQSLLTPAMAKARRVTRSSNAGDYGLGIIRQGDWLAHSGQALGWTANVACNTKTGAVVAYATNSTNGTIDIPMKVGKMAFPSYAKAINYGL